MATLPPWLRQHDERRKQDDLREYAEMSVDEKWQRFMQASAWSWALLSANPHRAAALEYREPRSPESIALWRRLMRQSRG